jgi:hypothetical protein
MAMKVRLTVTIELDDAAQEAWMLNYGVEKNEIRNDVKRHFGNQVTGEDFTNIIGAPLNISWK